MEAAPGAQVTMTINKVQGFQIILLANQANLATFKECEQGLRQ